MSVVDVVDSFLSGLFRYSLLRIVATGFFCIVDVVSVLQTLRSFSCVFG